MRQRLHHHVEVVVVLDVVHAHEAGRVLAAAPQRPARPRHAVQLRRLPPRVPRVGHVLDVVEAVAPHLVALGQHVDAPRLEVDVDVVVLVERVEVGVRLGPPALVVPPADEARVHVDVGQRHRAQLLEVEVEHVAVDGVEVQVVVAFCRRRLAYGRRGCAGGLVVVVKLVIFFLLHCC